MSGPRLSIACSLLVALAGCSAGGERLRAFCASDLDCPPGYRCQADTGLCVCASDAVCPPGYLCAPDGRCRKRVGCESNLDCPAGTFCDSTTGTCIEQGKCTADKHCPPGQICTELFRCSPGCRESGDCPLGWFCRDGQCRQGGCDSTRDCAVGELCDVEQDTCLVAEGRYCTPCQATSPANPFPCGEGANFCVMTNNDPSLEPFCGVDCSDGQECPNGFSCNLILVAPGGSCRSDGECVSGQCHINEGDEVGFCLCATDSECPTDACDDFTGHCRITRRPCLPGGNDCDRPIYCIDGLCLIGRNCTPIEGLDCAGLGY